MKTAIKLFVLGLSVSTCVVVNAYAAGDPEMGRAKAIICIGCHGIDGNNDNPLYPILAGQGEAYLSKQLTDFKTGARTEEHMNSMVEALTLSDIPNVANYFSIQKRKDSTLLLSEPHKEFDKAKGKLIYNTGIAEKSTTACAACHASNGTGNATAKFPSLAGQHADYIRKTLKEFKSGTRHNDPNKMMRGVTSNLTDKEINALSNYISTINK